MYIVMLIAAGLWLLQAFSVLSQANSAIHQILGCLYLSFGVLFVAAASIIEHLSFLAKQPRSDPQQPSAAKNSQ